MIAYRDTILTVKTYMRDTPRTDELARGNHVVPTEWAEDLEREINQLRQALRGIQQLALGQSDKIVLHANVAEIARVAEVALKENSPASDERTNIRRLEKLGFAEWTEEAKKVAENLWTRLEEEVKKTPQSIGDRKTSDTPISDAFLKEHFPKHPEEQWVEAQNGVTFEKPIEFVLKKLERERGQLREALQAVMGWNPKPEPTDRPQTVARFEADMDQARKTLEITK